MLNNRDFKILTTNEFNKLNSIKHIYKYINLNDGIEHILGKNTFKFTQPTDFNDPFDCYEKLINIPLDKKQFRKYLKEQSVAQNISEERLETIFQNAIKPDTLFETIKQHKDKFKLTCFSKIFDETLMWSHYADKHKGLCIGFVLDNMSTEYKMYPVHYSSKIQTINPNTFYFYAFYYLVTFKEKKWAYEKEIRAVSLKSNSILSYPKSAVKEVIFGCQVNPDTITETIDKIKEMNYSGVTISKMEIDTKTLGLKKVPIMVIQN